MLRLAAAQRLRRSAIQSQFRERARGRRVTALFSGGPLDRVRTTVPAEVDASGHIRFCVVTDRGLAQPLCTRAGGTDWRFVELVSGAL